MQIPNYAMQILCRLQARGFKCYVVGGCVRDCLLSLLPNDWDVCTNALPDEIIECFADMTSVLTGVSHGTVTVISEGIPVEITTFRTEGAYSDRRHPDTVTFVSSVTDDLSRRDFTINAMAYHPDDGLIDPFGGQQDLKDGILRCVGDAKKRFSEDALRIVRALRFCSCYGLSMEASTERALRETAPLLSNIAVERIQAELNKLLLGDFADDILRTYAEIFSIFIPEWRYVPLSHAVKDLDVRLALLLCDNDELTVEQCLRRLRYDNHTVRTVSSLVKYHTRIFEPNKILIKYQLYELGKELFFKLLDFKKAKNDSVELVKELADECVNECFSIEQLSVNGNDLSALGFSGKSIGEMLRRLLFEVIEEHISNEREQLLSYCRKTLDKC